MHTQDTQQFHLKAIVKTQIQGREMDIEEHTMQGVKLFDILERLTTEDLLWGSDDDEWRLNKEDTLFIRCMEYGYHGNPTGWSRQFLSLYINNEEINKERYELAAEYINDKVF